MQYMILHCTKKTIKDMNWQVRNTNITFVLNNILILNFLGMIKYFSHTQKKILLETVLILREWNIMLSGPNDSEKKITAELEG